MKPDLCALPLLPETIANLKPWLENPRAPVWVGDSIRELVERAAWDELNDRFHRELEFGTGGMRGRTIGRIVTAAERGDAPAGGAPTHAGVGSNLLNDFTLSRAIRGLFSYTRGFLQSARREVRPRLVVVHDVRHFSRHFCQFVAQVWSELGGEVFVFDGPRSTPQLSFTVRYLRAHCGAVITASHNPPHDNGLKVYFEDGGQVVSPHAEGIVAAIQAIPLDQAFHQGAPGGQATGAITVQSQTEEAYHQAALQAVINPAQLASAGLRVAFTALHGTGGVAAVPLLRRAGVEVIEVQSQREADANFSTVASPNPENPAALAEVMALAQREKVDLALGTDPDGDRVGIAVPDGHGRWTTLSGNQTGALLTDFRLKRLKETGMIPTKGSQRVAVIKTFVTSELIDAIALSHGVKVVNTLTGFKWIGARMRHYDDIALRRLHQDAAPVPDLLTLLPARRAALLQQHSTWFAFGAEESYGYLPVDTVRDKDANASCLAVAELVAHARIRGSTVIEMLDHLYTCHGYHDEGVAQLVCEGADGTARIARILASYREKSPVAIDGLRVAAWTDHGRTTVVDADGETVPPQDLYVAGFANGYRCAIRGSGTEPKLKFYLFAREPSTHRDNLAALKIRVRERLAALGAAMKMDAERRGG